MLPINRILCPTDFSAVANVNDPDNQTPILLDDIIAAAAKIEPSLQRLIVDVLKTV